jgi:diguanylate cyclase (GGDEF)-like protein
MHMANILVVEDELLIARLLKETLEIEGYQVVTIRNGEDAVRFALRETPHLVILDIMLPGIDGYEVIRRLRNHPKTMHIPIIVLTALGGADDKVRAFERDADDYVTKPFDTDELLARIRRQLRRVQQSFLSPLTGLPGGLQVVRAINYKLNSQEPWSILYLDLDNFKAFNDVYGFLAGNDMILLVGQICQRFVHQYGGSEDFIGHIGGDDFVIVTSPTRAKTLCTKIMASYKEESAALYLPEDLARGSISSVDRKGCPYQFPLVSLSIGVVNNQLRRPHSVQEVGYLAAEAKRHAKQSTDNIFYISSHRDRSYSNHERHTPHPTSASSKTTSTSAARPSSSSILPYAYSQPYEDLLCFTDDKAVRESHVHG